jgi:hypothetical protein
MSASRAHTHVVTHGRSARRRHVSKRPVKCNEAGMRTVQAVITAGGGPQRVTFAEKRLRGVHARGDGVLRDPAETTWA